MKSAPFLAVFCFALAANAFAAPPPPASSRYKLITNVAVTSEKVTLSDLLPPQAPPWIRDSASAVVIGTAPLPGNSRLFSREQIRSAVDSFPELSAAMDIPEQVAVQRAHRILSREEVRNAIAEYLARRGFDLPRGISLQDVSLGAAVPVPSSGAPLTVQRMIPDPFRRRTLFRLALPQQPRTPPFYAALPALLAPPSAPGGGSSPTASTDPAPPEERASRPRATPVGSRRKPLLVHAGQTATLIFAAGGVTIQTSVMPLQAGAEGERIWVRELLGRRKFRAVVVAPDSVQSSLSQGGPQ